MRRYAISSSRDATYFGVHELIIIVAKSSLTKAHLHPVRQHKKPILYYARRPYLTSKKLENR